MSDDNFPAHYTPTEAEAIQAEARAETPAEQVKTLSIEQAIQTMKLMRARADAETAEYQKRLVMQQFRPCRLYPVLIFHDGIRWVCSYGVFGDKYRDFLPETSLGQSGVEAYGDSPEEAMQNFDSLWVGTMLEEEGEEENDEPDDCPA